MTLTAAEVRALDHAGEILLVTITTPSGAVLRISDRVITVDGVTYRDLLGGTSEIVECVSRTSSAALNSDVTLTLANNVSGAVEANGVVTAFAALITLNDTHPFAGSRVTIYSMFVDGTRSAEPALVFVGVAESPRSIGRESFSLRCGAVPAYQAKTFSLQRMLATDYPLALPSDSGKCFPDLIGQFKTVECRRTRWPVFESDNITQLRAAIDADDTTIPVDNTVGFGEYADEEKIVWIGGERISWADKTTTPQEFTGCVRGLAGGTAAASHADNSQVTEHPETTAEVTIAGHAISVGVELFGEFGDLLAPVPALSVVITDLRSYATIQKANLVVPQTLLDTISFGGSAEPTYNSDNSTQGNFAGTVDSYVSASRTWPSNPYLVGGVPQYSDLSLQAEWTLSQANGTHPSGTNHGLQFTADGFLYIVINGVTYTFARGYTTWQRTSGAPDYTYTAISRAVTTYMASVVNIPLSTLLDWGSAVSCVWSGEQHCYYAASLDLSYRCLLNENATTKTGTVTDEKYFRRIFASGWGRIAPAGDFYGSEGESSTRPDHVMKQWIVNKMNFAESEIDTASFDAAGAFYASKSPEYSLSVRVSEAIDAEAELHAMAFESRSVVYYSLGKWYLRVIEDAAPADARTILLSGLAGEKSTFVGGFTPMEEIANIINLSWDKNDGPAGSKDPYRKSTVLSSVVDGYPELPYDLKLNRVINDNQATDVGNIYLAQHKRALKTVTFPVFWDDADLKMADSIIVSGLGYWEGLKFWITNESRNGNIRATYECVEWWT